ncbi:MAG: peptidoglycan-binding protein, partial [Woeseiaceae bacterium]|nr:peptidoglycan-binding protein [Woeseiaceae bacterium]
PRLINVICDRALLGAYSREARRVNRNLVRRAAAEISGKAYQPAWLRYAPHALVTAGVLVIAVGLWSVFDARRGGETSVQAATVQASETPPAAADTTLPPQTVADLPAQADSAPLQPPAAEAASGPSLDEALQLASDLTAFGPAFDVLARLWGLDIAADAVDGCSEAQALGYECLGRRGSWANLRQLDRPAVLTLTDTNGGQHRVVLTAVRGDVAELSIGGVDVAHPVSELLELWFGQYLLLWKPALGESVPLGPGSQNPTVVWLRESLAAIDERYRAEPMSSDVYDNTLAGRVRDFQRDHRLDVDGLAGRQTQIIINSLVAGDDMPRLTTPRLAQD